MTQQTGIINTALSAPTKKDPLSGVSGYGPEKINLTPETDTVEGRLGGLLQKDNPLIQASRTRAAQEANQKGLLNSSMAVQAGEQAAYNTALPIAQQDAQSSLVAKQANQSAANQAGQFNAGSENQVGLQELQGQQSIDLATLQGQNQKDIAGNEAQYKQMMQANDSAARFFSQITSSVGDIMKEPSMSPEAKATQVQKQMGLLYKGMEVIGAISNLDLKDLLNFDSAYLDEALLGKKPSATGTTQAPTAPASSAGKRSDWSFDQGGDQGDIYVNRTTGERRSFTAQEWQSMPE